MSSLNGLLIHWHKNEIAPSGGPSGYLYNLRCGLNELGVFDYKFLPEVGARIEQNALLQKLIPRRIKDIRRLIRYKAFPEIHKKAVMDYSDYKAIHFHTTMDLYFHRDALETFEGKVLLTSHSPCVFHKELIANLDARDYQRHKAELNLERIDEYAFQRADYIVFPCKEAEEPYFHTWEAYKDLRDEKKIKYMPTGIEVCKPLHSRKKVRKEFGIPEEAFVLSYVGRHNEIKGYADLKSIAPDMLDRYDDLWFLNAGQVSPIRGLNHPRWIEVGWTDDPHSIISAADAFVLPNKETYFDLVLLEVLSLGQIAIVSRAGGNKYFSKFNLPGLFMYDTIREMPSIVASMRTASRQTRRDWGIENRKVFDKHFTCRAFASRYVELIRSLDL